MWSNGSMDIASINHKKSAKQERKADNFTARFLFSASHRWRRRLSAEELSRCCSGGPAFCGPIVVPQTLSCHLHSIDTHTPDG